MTASIEQQNHPVNIEVDVKQSELRITWADGVQSRYTFTHLRKICPCATCQEQRKVKDDPLIVLPPAMLAASDKLDTAHPAEMVGNYALQLFWDDGHRTGIYTFEFLRQQAAEG